MRILHREFGMAHCRGGSVYPPAGKRPHPCPSGVPSPFGGGSGRGFFPIFACKYPNNALKHQKFHVNFRFFFC